MSISERLVEDLKTAMKAGDKLRVTTIRGLRAAFQSAQLEAAKQQYDAAVRTIEARYPTDAVAREAALAAVSADPHTPLTPEAEVAVLAKEVKRRQEAAAMYLSGGRAELAAQEEAELALLRTYLPAQLSDAELRPAVAAVIAELGLQGPASLGKLMPVLMQRFKGRADGQALSQMARELLA